jgi:hypothetical protein
MTFKTIFDAESHGYSTWWFPAIGLIFIFWGLLVAFRPMFTSQNTGPLRKVKSIMRWSFVAFGILWISITFYGRFREYITASSALHTRNYQVVEGPVTYYVPMPSDGYGEESFVVNGVSFGYSDNNLTVGFHNTASHGGPIREGLYVRVTYLDNLILRLEIAT